MTKELLNSCSVVLGLGTFTKCKINKVDAIGVDDSEHLGTVARVRTHFGRVVAKLEEVTGIPERGFLKIRTVPLLLKSASESHRMAHVKQ